MHACMPNYLPTYTYACMHAYARTHARACAHAHTRSHACMHACMHACTSTRLYTHAPICFTKSIDSLTHPYHRNIRVTHDS